MDSHRLSWIPLILVFLLCSFFELGVCAEKAPCFSNPVLRLVDQGDHAYLFRGKMPEQDGRFCYEALTNQFKECLARTGKELSPNYDLLCISLLNCSENKERKVEAQWFAQNPDKGRLWMYPLFGCWVDPRIVSSSFRKSVYGCDVDGIQLLLQQVKQHIDHGGSEGKDLVIYIHCHAGKDRTGEAMACYLMQYKGYSYRQALELCKEIAGRKLRRVSVNAIRWHASYLHDVMSYRTIGEIY